MKLQKLLKDINYKTIMPDVLSAEISGISVDHRKVKPGDVFIALKGENFDGNDYVTEALINGASAVISDKNHNLPECVKVDNARSAYAIVSKHFYDDACDKLKIIAVTGTNGKTTTCNTIADILKTNGKKVGVIGTLGAKVLAETIDTGMTTPDPDKLHKIFKQMQDAGMEYVVMEASAHALALKKLDGINFEIGVLTNITEDHLDYFKTMDSYAKAKFKLFDKNRVKKAVICQGKCFDDEFLKKLNVPYVNYCLNGNDLQKAFVSAKILESDLNGSQFSCEINGQTHIMKTNLVGDYNVENILASICVCSSLGLTIEQIKKGVACTLPVEGRFNVINFDNKNIVIDFAHTPDGLEKVLTTAKSLSQGPLFVVFGCGGNRDKKKRSLMGEVASRIADEVVLTTDNPRFEKPLDIIADIKKGIKKDNANTVVDRETAIEYAIEQSPRGSTIVIAGKGGERYQEINGRKIEYNDFDVVKEVYLEIVRRNGGGSFNGDEILM